MLHGFAKEKLIRKTNESFLEASDKKVLKAKQRSTTHGKHRNNTINVVYHKNGLK